MALYKYIKEDGSSSTVDAPDSATAIKTAPGIGVHSGVMLVDNAPTYNRNPDLRSDQTGVPSPYSSSSTPVGSSTTAIESLLKNSASSDAKTPLGKTRSKLEKALSTIPEAPTYDSVLATKKEAAQGLIDALNASYAPKFAAEETAAAGREARTRALNVSAGLSGSTFASTEAQKTADVNQESMGLLRQERDAKIQAILGEVDSRTSEEYAKRRESYLKEVEGNYQKLNEFQKEQSGQALKNASTLAAAGVGLAALKSKAPDTYKQLLKESGYDSNIFDIVYNQSLPENQQRKYQYQKIGHTLYAISVDPATNKIVTEAISPEGTTYDDFRVGSNGEGYFIDYGNGTVTPAGSGLGGKTTGGFRSGNLTLTAEDLSSGEKALEASRGADGHVDSAVYNAMYQKWVSNGGLLKDFLSKYPPKNYANPSDTSLPAFLRPAGSKSTARSLD